MKWPKSKADEVTANCNLDRDRVDIGNTGLLRAQIDATESRGHTLSYIWTGNGGKITGVGPQVQVNPSGLSPGEYSLTATARDAYQHSAACTLTFHVMPPADLVTMACSLTPPEVERGSEAYIEADAKDTLGHPLRYRWFTNGGTIRGEGPQVALDTADLVAGVYTVTGRVEDESGLASDCSTVVTVKLPAPVAPPETPVPSNVAEIVFARNLDLLEPSAQLQLQRVLARLQAEPGARLSIESYAGPDESNPGPLATQRALSVKRYLMENGVAEPRLQVMVGLGGKRGGLRNRTLDLIWLPQGLEY